MIGSLDPCADTMSIETLPGDEIIFAFPNNGRDYDKAICKERLVIGALYAVDWVEISSWSSRVYLEGYDAGFNTVMFANRIKC